MNLRKAHYKLQGNSISEDIKETFFTEIEETIPEKCILSIKEYKSLLNTGYTLEELLSHYIITQTDIIALRKYEDNLNIIKPKNQVFSAIKEDQCEVKFAEKRNLKEIKEDIIHWDITELFNNLTTGTL